MKPIRNASTMRLARIDSMGLAEAGAHLAALAAVTWLLSRVRAHDALAVVDDRCRGSLRQQVERAAGRSVDRLRREAARLGLETAAVGDADRARRPEVEP